MSSSHILDLLIEIVDKSLYFLPMALTQIEMSITMKDQENMEIG